MVNQIKGIRYIYFFLQLHVIVWRSLNILISKYFNKNTSRTFNPPICSRTLPASGTEVKWCCRIYFIKLADFRILSSGVLHHTYSLGRGFISFYVVAVPFWRGKRLSHIHSRIRHSDLLCAQKHSLTKVGAMPFIFWCEQPWNISRLSQFFQKTNIF